MSMNSSFSKASYFFLFIIFSISNTTFAPPPPSDDHMGNNRKPNKTAMSAIKTAVKKWTGKKIEKGNEDILEEFHDLITGQRLDFKGLVADATEMLESKYQDKKIKKNHRMFPVTKRYLGIAAPIGILLTGVSLLYSASDIENLDDLENLSRQQIQNLPLPAQFFMEAVDFAILEARDELIFWLMPDPSKFNATVGLSWRLSKDLVEVGVNYAAADFPTRDSVPMTVGEIDILGCVASAVQAGQGPAYVYLETGIPRDPIEAKNKIIDIQATSITECLRSQSGEGSGDNPT